MKNCEKAFLENKNMILKLQDITIFKLNFLDKAANKIFKNAQYWIRFVNFVDSKFECDQVKNFKMFLQLIYRKILRL